MLVAILKTSERYVIHQTLGSVLGQFIHRMNVSLWLERGHYSVYFCLVVNANKLAAVPLNHQIQWFFKVSNVFILSVDVCEEAFFNHFLCNVHFLLPDINAHFPLIQDGL